jgi:aminoglycoside phosphotransferase (APT) family kinase protein
MPTHVDGRAGIDAALVARLVAAQFPQWGALPVAPVAVDGWDNRTYRLGDELAVRLPTGAQYALAVPKEHRWLPVLAPQLPVRIPTSLAVGAPAEGYPFAWSVRAWLDGETVMQHPPADLTQLAVDVADFVRALQRVDASGGPRGGRHSFFRGASLMHYDKQTRSCLRQLHERVDTDAAAAVWEAALAARWDGRAVWFHGDVASGNLLVRAGRLVAVIDFGTSGVGDPACDLVITWTLFTGASRRSFRERVGQDDGTWARARGWALWKALLMLAGDDDPSNSSVNLCVVADVLAEH